MPAKSKSQQRFMGMVRAAQKGEKPASAKVAKVAKSIGKGDAEDFASTKHKGLPKKVKKETKVRSLIRKMVREIMAEAPRPIHHSQAKALQVWKNHIPKAQKLLKKLVAKGQVEIDTKSNRVPGYIGVTTTKKMFDDVLELLLTKNIKVREGVNEDFAGAYPKAKRASFDKKRQKQSEVLGYKLTGHPDVKTEIDDATIKEVVNLTIHKLQELHNSQGEETDFKKGDLVKDINPDCVHHGSEGEVTKGGTKNVTYKVTNNGATYKEGDELEKTVDQLVKLSQTEEDEKAKKQPMGEGINVRKWVNAVNKGKDVVVYDKKGKRYNLQGGDNKSVQVTDHWEDAGRRNVHPEKTWQTLPLSKIKKIMAEAKKRDYKTEYKKFQSSDKSKKYRAELNAYNRKKGTYGNGDGKDASHKGGKIAGFEEQSK